MNSYLSSHLNQLHRSDLVAEAATNRLLSEATVRQPEPGRGIRAALRRIFSAPDATSIGFLPRLVDYPTARH